MKKLLLLIAFFTGFSVIQLAQAEVVKGRIQTVSKKAGTVQIGVKDKKVVIRIDKNTRLEGFASLNELSPPDLIEAEREPGQAASRVKKIVFALPAGVEIGTQQLLQIMTGKEPYKLYDARPVKRFGKAHIPSARPAHPRDDNFLSLLPEDKNELIVFYCGGPTCPYTGQSVEKAQKAGYMNLKGYQAGLPGWKKSKLPVHTESGWLVKNLNTQTVILDVRDLQASSQTENP